MDHTKKQSALDSKNECLMIMGMHCSGNSFLAECLQQIGVNFGIPSTDNVSTKSGVFENQDIVLLHEILFRNLDFRWDMIGHLPEGWVESKAALQAEEKLVQIIKNQFHGNGLWAVKDPRICRLMPLWFKVLARMEITPCFIHMLHHPYEVALSLQEKHAIELSKGQLLWLVYNREALQASQQNRHIVITYDQLSADPVSAVNRIVDNLNIDLHCDPLDYTQTLTDFVQHSL